MLDEGRGYWVIRTSAIRHNASSHKVICNAHTRHTPADRKAAWRSDSDTIPPWAVSTQPTLGAEERETNWRAIGVGVGVVVVIVLVLFLISRTEQKAPGGPPAYAANIKFSDLKMSAAENFVGATVSYIDGTVANAGTQTVTHVVVEVTFRDSMGQLAQRDTVPLRVLQTSRPLSRCRRSECLSSRRGTKQAFPPDV